MFLHNKNGTLESLFSCPLERKHPISEEMVEIVTSHNVGKVSSHNTETEVRKQNTQAK